jgi:hypothetical protein
MKSLKVLIRTVIILAVISIPFYFIACDTSVESVAVKTPEQCDQNNTAEVTIQNNLSGVVSVYLDGNYSQSIQAGKNKVITVSAGVQHIIKYMYNGNDKCIHTRTFTKCSKVTLTCPVD